MEVGKIEQLTTNTFPHIREIKKPKKIDYDYIRLRTQTFLSEIDLSSLEATDIRRISVCMEAIAENELNRR